MTRSSPVDQKNHIPANIVCNDCHEGHTMRTGTATVPNLSPKLGRISGVNSAGSSVTVAQFEYEVCYKCHDNLMATQPYISRQVVQNNKRLQFAAVIGVVSSGTGGREEHERAEPAAGMDDRQPGVLHGLPRFGYGAEGGRRRTGWPARIEHAAAADRPIRYGGQHVGERGRVCVMLPLPRPRRAS